MQTQEKGRKRQLLEITFHCRLCRNKVFSLYDCQRLNFTVLFSTKNSSRYAFCFWSEIFIEFCLIIYLFRSKSLLIVFYRTKLYFGVKRFYLTNLPLHYYHYYYCTVEHDDSDKFFFLFTCFQLKFLKRDLNSDAWNKKKVSFPSFSVSLFYYEKP
jgi:hypothetical protein